MVARKRDIWMSSSYSGPGMKISLMWECILAKWNYTLANWYSTTQVPHELEIRPEENVSWRQNILAVHFTNEVGGFIVGRVFDFNPQRSGLMYVQNISAWLEGTVASTHSRARYSPQPPNQVTAFRFVAAWRVCKDYARITYYRAFVNAEKLKDEVYILHLQLQDCSVT